MRFRVVLGGDVDPVLAPHAVVDFAGVGEFGREGPGGHARLQIGEGSEDGEVEASAEGCTLDEVVEGVKMGDGLNAGSGVPEVGVGEALHGRLGGVVDDECRRGGGANAEEEIGSVAGPRVPLFEVSGGERGGDGVGQGGTVFAGERDELGGGELLRSRCGKDEGEAEESGFQHRATWYMDVPETAGCCDRLEVGALALSNPE